MSPYARANHIVTAVIVAHDGARWLPEVVAALHAQTRPVQRLVAVDTGSWDRSGAVLAELLGTDAVFGTERGTGFGSAVALALRHRPAGAPVNGRPAPGRDAVEWLWLLHDDCAPERDALEQLMVVAAFGRFAVLGPKARRWEDPRVLTEVGLRIDTAGRRLTGVDPDEYDQGQHDGDRDVLAVGSAGMLVRRDVWDSLGGFDPVLPLLYDDIDFCWRANAAGHRVRLVTGAAIRHAEAAATGRRSASAYLPPSPGFSGPTEPAPRLRREARRSALYVLFANLPPARMILSVLGNTAGSLLRALLALLVVKGLPAAWDELAALGAVIGHPLRLLRARRRRPAGRRRTYRIFRSSLPRGRALALVTDVTSLPTSRSGQPSGRPGILDSRTASSATSPVRPDEAGRPARNTEARHRAMRDGEAPQPTGRGGQPAAGEPPSAHGLTHRVMTSPGVLTTGCLIVITLIAGRELLGGGPLSGGALIPAWGGASGLWHEYLSGFHEIGAGSASAVPPYVAVLATVATILGGKPWLAVDLLLLGSVPLAGVTAYLAARRVTRWIPARIWAAAAYALLPAATGAVATGRIGTAVTIALLPLAGILAGRMLTRPGRQARRAAWAAGLTVAVAAAFVPLAWAVAACVAVVAMPLVWALGRNRRDTIVNLAIVAVVPAALLFPWTVQLFAHPSLFLGDSGIPRPGLADPALPASSLLLLNPGGPGVPPVWVTAGIAAVGLAALPRFRHRAPVAVGWIVALAGLLTAIVVSRVSAVPPGAAQAVTGWPGVPLTLAAAGVMLAAVAVSDAVPALLRSGRAGGRGMKENPAPPAIAAAWIRRFPGAIADLRGVDLRSLPWQRTGAALAVIAACSAPLLAAGGWIVRGAGDPLGRADAPVLPALVTASPGSGAWPGTLVLRPGTGRVTYAVLRGAPPLPGEAQLPEPSAARHRLDTIVAGLASGSGGEVGADGNALASFGIGFVLLPAPVDPGLSRLLDGAAGLRQLSMSRAFALWRVDGVTARVRVAEPGGAVVPVRSGVTDVEGAHAPAPGGTLELAAPADASWRATLNGKPLAALARPADGWAQAFRLPSGGGRLDVTRDMTGHRLSLIAEGLAFLVVAALALPGLQAAGTGDGAHGAAATIRRRPASHARRRRRTRSAWRPRRAQAPGPHQPGAHGMGGAVHGDAEEPVADERGAAGPVADERGAGAPGVDAPGADGPSPEGSSAAGQGADGQGADGQGADGQGAHQGDERDDQSAAADTVADHCGEPGQ